MRRFLCRTLLAVTAFALAVSLPALAQDDPPPANPSLADAAAALPCESGKPPAPPEALRPERASEATRPPSEALIRALMVISTAGGGRPYPLVPR